MAAPNFGGKKPAFLQREIEREPSLFVPGRETEGRDMTAVLPQGSRSSGSEFWRSERKKKLQETM